ncbi:kinesin-like protein KIF28P [Portunus trituberculatus]|uniref:kinesin-like protein KIF28P n=1 Tax=Portunus trituberculatus TaxID=210409 RepID=UPI001E1CDB85|nr:kinesin-like protein KIF28P [Portunus trituberculatus]
MKGNITTVTNPDDSADVKSFTYDYSYWSFDGCKEEPNGYFAKQSPNSKYADQNTVYNDLGGGVLANAWAGYNSTLFAYGQTGSGKSWSVIGYGSNKGIVPLFCNDLFNGITQNTEEKEFEVRFSMLEIYNEVVHDLLNPTKSKKGLKVRQHPKKGFYAEGLKLALVTNYNEIEQKMNEGTVNRTIASTNMNATSSRAHTIVGITVIQKFKNNAGQETAKQAVVNLVDLAAFPLTLAHNKRELGRKAKCVVSMKGNITTVTNPDDSADVKSFTYDYSYWSFDGCKEEPNGYFAKQSPNSSMLIRTRCTMIWEVES